MVKPLFRPALPGPLGRHGFEAEPDRFGTALVGADGRVASRTRMPRVTCSGSGSTLIRLARTLVPSQSTRAATKGTGTPGAAKLTMVKARTSPSVATSTVLNPAFPHWAQALRRSKKRAAQLVHSWAVRCG